MIEVQCTSCHTRYRIDEQVLPEGLPTFKCSRCGHVFSFEPRKSRPEGQNAPTPPAAFRVEPAKEPTQNEVRQSEPEESPSQSAGAGDEKLSGFPDPLTNAAHSDPLRVNGGPRVHSRPIKDEQPRSSSSQAGIEPQSAEPEESDSIATGEPPPAASSHGAAEQTEKFYSQLFTGKDPNTTSGENLSFDFADEERATEEARLARRSRRSGRTNQTSNRDLEQWEVGDDSSASDAIGSMSGPLDDTAPPPPRRRRQRTRDNDRQFTDDDEFIDEEEAPVYNRAMTHSARFFILLLFLVGIGFGALTMLINNAPDRSSAVLSYLPVVGDRFATASTPAKLVALKDVNAVYQPGKEGQTTLVISGSAENVGTASLRIVQLTAALRDSTHRSLASQAVYCGNNVSVGMIGQMTPHEIEFLQKLEPARTFALEPSASCRFVAVFMNPPSAARAYDVSVSQAVAGTAPDTEEPAS
ncbi:MAG TPA: zinc-ribbon domain-containing protein [Candidatus Binataceae bacterium]|nr:zinc-ribbon domain-containing protein [Candidatus Binataceae bacterium]